MTTDQKEKRNDEYNKYVKRVTPTHCLSANMLKAFILGGIICTIGQLIVNTCTQYFGLKNDEDVMDMIKEFREESVVK